MADGSPMNGDRSLRNVLIALPFSDRHVSRLRTRFPGVEFQVVDPGALGTKIADADAIAAWAVSSADLEKASRLRWLQTGGAGVESVLSPALAEQGILVTNASGVHAINIAEHVMAMMLYFARGFPVLVRHQLRREWKDNPVRSRVFELAGQRLLVVGLGDIGIALSDRAAAFGMEVFGVRRRPDQPAPPSVRRVGTIEALPDLLPSVDHVAICLPLTPRTAGLFERRMLARMQTSSYLYNIGRGGVILTQDLVDALEAGRLAGAGLDVTDPEPLPESSPLWGMENVLITAHTSGGTPHYWDRALELFEDNIDRFISGRPLRNVVNLSEGY